MKIKSLASLGILFGTMLFASQVYAADPTYTMGNPIDFYTKEEVTSLTPGQKVMVPVDINYDTGEMLLVQTELYFDKNVVNPGILYDENDTDIDDYNYSYAECFVLDQYNEDNMLAQCNFYEVDRRGNISVVGRPGGSIQDGYIMYNWDDNYPVKLNTDTPEMYYLFTVKDDIEGLNITGQNAWGNNIFNLKLIAIRSDGDTAPVRNVGGTDSDVKANACYGAFQVSIDSSALEYWVQSVSAVIDDTTTVQLQEYTNEDGTTVYKFPTRITSNNADKTTANVVIKAVVTDDEAGTTNERIETLASGTINLDSPTEYNAIG